MLLQEVIKRRYNMDDKAQGALEYLLLIGGALIVVAVVIAILFAVLEQGEEISNQALHKITDPFKNRLSGL
jgi:uncharacterized protein (UPF0333 family)